MYLMLCMRPDIAASVSKITQYATCYNDTHWNVVIRVMRYVKGMSTHSIILGNVTGLKPQEIVLSGSCNADWAGDYDNGHSTTRYLFTINGGTIAWQTRKQTLTVTSSTQAKYQALSGAMKEALWI